MKKIIILSIIAIILFASCEKELNQIPISSSTSLAFYSNTNDFAQSVNAIYGSLKPFPDRLMNLSETRSDNLYAVLVGWARDWDGINNFQKTISNNPYISEAWAKDYTGIYQANVLLDQLQKNGSVIADATLKTRFEAEAKFLRAFYYFDLLKWFGNLPIVDHPLTATEALAIPRSQVSDVYNLIISDLKFAGDNLPDVYVATEKGKATKYAAKGILALVYMTRSAPTYGIKGPGLGLNEWGVAFTLLNEIIGSSKFTFLPSYKDIFSYTNEKNAEVIFDIQYMPGANPVLGSSFPALLVPDGYFQSLGKVVGGTTNLRPVSNDLLDSYESGDTRKEFSIYTTGYVYNGEPENRSFVIKYMDKTKIPLNMIDWPINFIVLRYTDILMLKAECILHGATGTQGEVDAIVNQVRQRGGLLTPKVNVTLPQLMEERRKEFAGEGSRWHDLVRSGLVETVIPAWIAKEDVYKQIQPFQKNYIIYPIPLSEMDITQGLYTQNEGY